MSGVQQRGRRAGQRTCTKCGKWFKPAPRVRKCDSCQPNEAKTKRYLEQTVPAGTIDDYNRKWELSSRERKDGCLYPEESAARKRHGIVPRPVPTMDQVERRNPSFVRQIRRERCEGKQS